MSPETEDRIWDTWFLPVILLFYVVEIVLVCRQANRLSVACILASMAMGGHIWLEALARRTRRYERRQRIQEVYDAIDANPPESDSVAEK